MHCPVNNTHTSTYFTKPRHCLAWSSTGFKRGPLVFLAYKNNLLPTAITVAVSLFKFQNEESWRID
jgi:hypothetical protein